MTSDLAYPAQKEFSFLQTVVNEELGHRHERKDSNKEHGTGLNISSLTMSTFGLADRSGNMRTEDKEERLRGFSRKDDNSNQIWEDFLTEEEMENKKGSRETKREVTDERKCPNSGQSEKQSQAVTDMSNTGTKEDTDGRYDGVNGQHVAKKKKKKHILKQAAPATHSPAPPATHSPAPPATHSPAPPATHSPAPPATHPPAPPATHSPAPPATHSPAPPATHSPAPPATHPPAPPATHSPAPPATSGSQPNLSHHGNRRRDSNRQGTRSETDGRPRRRLGRRQRVATVRHADPVTSEQILHQKIQELHTLMVKPLIEPVQYLHQTRQELLRLQGFSQQRAAQYMESFPQQQSGSRVRQQQSDSRVRQQQSDSRFRQQSVAEWNSNDSDQGYSVLRSAQLHRTKVQRPWTSGQVRPRPDAGTRHQSRPYSAEHHVGSRNEGIDGNPNNGPGVSVTGSRGGGHGRKHGSQTEEAGDDSTRIKNATSGRILHQASPRTQKSQSPNRSDGTSQSHSVSPSREIEHLDTHLKNSHNPALRKWLKQKNKEIRRQKAEDRKRLREERVQKQDDVRARQEMFKDSEEKVKEWMLQKKKDARNRAEDKRREMQEKNKFRADREHGREVQGVLRTRSLEHLPAHTSADRGTLVVPDIRPVTVQGQISQDNCQPPVSKFVYKRPVSGHVRLIKLQQKQKEDAKKSEEEKILLEKKLAEEKCQKMRMSYDQWLVKKREEDYTKRQDKAKQKALAKSDPELERILPELARRRIDNIQRGKKRVDTGMTNLDNDVKTRLAGDHAHAETPENIRSDTTSDILDVSGQKQVLKQRPATVKSSFHPQVSKSPRRPMSANLQQSGALDASRREGSLPQPFTLPFPPQEGAPKYVVAAQKKLFSPHVTSNLPQSPETHQGEPHVASDSPADSQTTPHQIALQTQEGKADGDKHHPDLEAGRNQTATEPHEADNSFFVTHGNLADVRDGEEGFSHAELGQKVAQVPEGGHWKKFIDELDISHQENVEHSPNHRHLQESDATACEGDATACEGDATACEDDATAWDGDEEISDTEGETCESDVREDRTSNHTSAYATLEAHQHNTDHDCTESQADIPEVNEKMAVLEESTHENNLELSGHGVSGKHVSFLAEDVVHEVRDVSAGSDTGKDDSTGEDHLPASDLGKDDSTREDHFPASDLGKDDSTGEDDLPATQAIDAPQGLDHQQASLDHKEDDDDEDIFIAGKTSQQTLQGDVDASNSSPTNDLFPDEDVVQESLHVSGRPDMTTDNTDREI